MKIEQIYTGCLAQGAYYIVSNGEAAIIDPLRETKPYLDRLTRDGVQLKFIFETHFHADFVSGHLDLSRATGASIVYGPGADCGFDCISAQDGQEFKIGTVSLRVLHTPGHTLESSTFLLLDENQNPHAIFSGDTLFLGDVGRPDLAQKSADTTQEELAGMLYDSLMNKIMPLPDHIIVYPAHGAGSACGKNMMKETTDTLGNQKRMNYALNQPDKKSFINAVLDGLLPPPAYFGANVAMNKKGYEQVETVLARGNSPLSPGDFESAAHLHQAVILDCRSAADFCRGFIPNAINIGIQGDFAPWVGNMIVDVAQPLLLVCDSGKEAECVLRLSRVGFDNVLGYLEGGVDAWTKEGRELDFVHRISAQDFATKFQSGDLVLDVRKESEFAAEHIEGAKNMPLSFINEWFSKLDAQKPFFIHCAGGYRSMIAASVLQSRGIRNFMEIEGGYKAISDTSIPKTNFICQSKS